MSQNELERLARIRIQITGETLERALAVLRGDTAEADIRPRLRVVPDPEPSPDVEPVPEGTAPPAPDADAEPARQAPAPRRPHLRSV
ncbi:hypothetical protein [Streptomyces sp. NPDC093097]|uniref:hypothetical protein n=1 Tax=Streptomyces sp. NPDC093097 TaxID=3366027 RepID=UPI00381F684B